MHINAKSNDVFEEFVIQKSMYIAKYKGWRGAKDKEGKRICASLITNEEQKDK